MSDLISLLDATLRLISNNGQDKKLSKLASSMVRPGGYTVDMFLDKLTKEEKEKYECGICFLITKNPCHCVNKHQFCRSCVTVWTGSGDSENHNKCPVCRARGYYLPSGKVADSLNSKVVRCLMRSCVWTGQLRDIQQHRHILSKKLFADDGCANRGTGGMKNVSSLHKHSNNDNNNNELGSSSANCHHHSNNNNHSVVTQKQTSSSPVPVLPRILTHRKDLSVAASATETSAQLAPPPSSSPSLNAFTDAPQSTSVDLPLPTTTTPSRSAANTNTTTTPTNTLRQQEPAPENQQRSMVSSNLSRGGTAERSFQSGVINSLSPSNSNSLTSGSPSSPALVRSTGRNHHHQHSHRYHQHHHHHTTPTIDITTTNASDQSALPDINDNNNNINNHITDMSTTTPPPPHSSNLGPIHHRPLNRRTGPKEYERLRARMRETRVRLEQMEITRRELARFQERQRLQHLVEVRELGRQLNEVTFQIRRLLNQMNSSDDQYQHHNQ